MVAGCSSRRSHEQRVRREMGRVWGLGWGCRRVLWLAMSRSTTKANRGRILGDVPARTARATAADASTLSKFSGASKIHYDGSFGFYITILEMNAAMLRCIIGEPMGCGASVPLRQRRLLRSTPAPYNIHLQPTYSVHQCERVNLIATLPLTSVLSSLSAIHLPSTKQLAGSMRTHFVEGRSCPRKPSSRWDPIEKRTLLPQDPHREPS